MNPDDPKPTMRLDMGRRQFVKGAAFAGAAALAETRRALASGGAKIG